MADVRNTYIHFNKGMMSCIVLVLVLVGVVMSSGSSDEYEELDPFDMVNFDHVKMKMRKKTPIVEEVKPAENKPDSTPVQDPLPEMKDTEQSSPKQDDMQVPSPPPLDASEVKDCVGDETSKDPPAAVISCPALSLFQQFVSRLLRFVGDKVSKMDENSQTELCLRMHLTSRELEVLESFKNDQSRDQVFSAHDVLLEAIKGAHVVQSDDPSFHFLWFEEKLGMTVEKTFWVLLNVVLLVALAAVLSKLRFSWALVRWMTFISCLLSIWMTWFRLYKGELAKQHKTMMKDLPQGCTKLPEGSGLLDNLFNFFTHYFTFKQDACLEFYEHIFVDPIVKVSPMEALAVAVVQTVLKPMRTVGTEISEFLRALVKDLPVQWQMVTVVIVFSFFALVLLLTCGYRVKIPFLLAIESTSTLEQSQTEEVKALKTQLHELQAAVENIGAAGRSQEDIAMLQPSQSPAPQPLPPASHRCRATHVEGDKSMTKTTRPPIPEMGETIEI